MDAQRPIRITSLNGIRGGACILIAFFWHYQHFGEVSPQTFGKLYFLVYTVSPWMVELFFMISGFTMVYNYAARIREEGLSFVDYMHRRLNRLWPLSIVTLLFVTAIQYMYLIKAGTTFVDQNFDLYHFVLNVLMLQSGWFENTYSFNTPIWFISTLMLCYFLFYLIVSLRRNRRFDSIVLYCIPVFFGWIVRCGSIRLPFAHVDFAARGYYSFFIGALMSEVYGKKGGGGKRFIPLLGAFAGIAFATVIARRLIGFTGAGNIFVLFVWIVFPAMLLVAIYSKVFGKILNAGLLQRLGSISIDVYFWHFPIQLAMAAVLLMMNRSIPYRSFLFYLIYVVAVYVVSLASFRIRTGKKPEA